MCIHLVRVLQYVDGKCKVQVSEKEENVPHFCHSMLTAMSVLYCIFGRKLYHWGEDCRYGLRAMLRWHIPEREVADVV